MKRLVAIILSALILFSFAACDLSSRSGTTDIDDPPTHANRKYI